MNITRRCFAKGAALSTLGLYVSAPMAASLQASVIGGMAFGSTWRVVHEPRHDHAVLRGIVEQVIADVDATMSPWRRDSAISIFNARQSTLWHPQPPMLCHVVEESLSVARLTSGAFDPTVGPAVARFGFGPIEGRTGHYTHIDVTPSSMRKHDGGLTIDLCGIAKGYALDEIRMRLAAEGVDHAFIELGGEVAALGEHPSGRPWRAAIERPGEATVNAQRIVEPGSLTLATSAHLPQGYRGRLMLSHLIDPRTLRPAGNAPLAVSVLAPSAMRQTLWQRRWRSFRSMRLPALPSA